jgi:hypothetical protein
MNFMCRHCLEINITTEDEYINNYEFCSKCYDYVEEDITKSFYTNKYMHPDFSYEFDEWFLMIIEYYYNDHISEYSDSDVDSENAY